METLIIPDVHEKIDKLKIIIKEFSYCDSIIFLGDFFDSFDQPFSKFKETVYFLKDNLANEKYNFLFGNHDLHYFYPWNFLKCSGWEYEKNKFIKETNFSEEELGYFSFYNILNERFLVSHAGISKNFLHPSIGDFDTLQSYLFLTEDKILADDLKIGNSHPLLMPGKIRGGYQKCGGITWCDWRKEFEPLTFCKQIVGHTITDYPKENDGNYNLDCDLEYVMLVHSEEEKGKVFLKYQ